MPKTLQSLPARLAIFFAVLSAGFWLWSARLPKSEWESSTTATLPCPPTPTPVLPTPGKKAPEGAPPAVAKLTPAASAPSPSPPHGEPVPIAPPVPAEDVSTSALPQAPASPGGEAIASAPAVAAATPALLEIGDIAKQPRLWPRQVLTLVPINFPVIINGVNSGSVRAPAGSPVVLRKVNADGTVEIELRGLQTTVKASDTDVLKRARARGANP